MNKVNKQLQVLLATTIGSSIVILDGSIVNLALPKIATDLHVGFASLQWITDGYLLSLSALILLGGSLGDIFGRKKVYLIGLVGFGVSSLLCAIAPDALVLIGMRILQGIFGALLVPGALAIINTSFAAKERGHAIGRWTAWSSIAVVLAPFLGGGILQVASWRWIFLINIPLVVACFLLGSSSIAETKNEHPRTVDGWGAVFVTLALAAITYSLIEGPAMHWSLLPIAALVAGVALSMWFLVHESRTKDPMVKLSLFESRNFVGSNIMTFMMYGALGGFMFALVIYLQTYLHYSAIQAGMSVLPVSILLILFAGKIGRLSAQYGPRFFMTAGPLLAGLGMSLLFFLRPGDGYIMNVLPGIVLFGAGLALLVSPLTTTVMTSVSDVHSGIASGINNAVSRAAGLIVIAVLGFFGASSAYPFAAALCAFLAFGSGIVSFVFIRKEAIADASV
jgi:EmrB/QacA subfamily drug resistance transporter